MPCLDCSICGGFPFRLSVAECVTACVARKGTGLMAGARLRVLLLLN
jgi:hypothetical protein